MNNHVRSQWINVLDVRGLICYCNTEPCRTPEANNSCVAKAETRCYTHILVLEDAEGNPVHDFQYGCLGEEAATTFQVCGF